MGYPPVRSSFYIEQITARLQLSIAVLHPLNVAQSNNTGILLWSILSKYNSINKFKIKALQLVVSNKLLNKFLIQLCNQTNLFNINT